MRRSNPPRRPTLPGAAGRPQTPSASANLRRQRPTPGYLAACLLGSALATRAATADLPSAGDTFIDDSHPSNNAGGLAWFDAGRDGVGGVRRGLLRFDLTSIPSGSVVTSAVVQLTVLRVPALGPANSTFDLFRLNAAWGEGTRLGNNGATATPGDATWTARELSTATWTTPGAQDDAEALASASASVGATAGEVVTWEDAALIADVQAWLDTPARNFGWLLRSQAESTSRSVRGFASRENPTAAPVLRVGFTPPVSTNPPPVVALAQSTNGTSLQLTWSGGTGPFALEWKERLLDPVWTVLTTTATSPFEIPANVPTAFFRIGDLAPESRDPREPPQPSPP